MDLFGKFELLAPLAYGGMGEIFLARQRGVAGIERLVVVKRILPHLAQQPQFVEMFLDEARVAALLDHPNIVPIYDIGHVEGSYFIAMPYVAGLSLRKLMQATMDREILIPIEACCSILLQALAGLHYAHERTTVAGRPLNVVHRDVSPSNLMVEEQGRVLLLDFGVAKATNQVRRETDTSSVKGKLTYMSPEQCRGEILDRRSDLFSLGIIAHELVSGRRLFRRKTEYLVFRAITEDPIPDPRELRPDLPDPVAAVILRALQRDADGRFATAEQMRLELQQATRRAGLSEDPAQLGRFVNGNLADLLQEQREVVLQVREYDGAMATAEEPTCTVGTGSLSQAQWVESAPSVRSASAPAPAQAKRRWLLVGISAGLLVLAAGLFVVLGLLGPTLHGPPLRLGVAPYLPADVLKRDLAPLKGYLERELDRPVEVVVPSSYGETVSQLLAGQLDLADLPPYPYLLARRRNPKVVPLVTVVAAGAASYEGYLVVRRADRVEGLTSLKGRRVCYVDRTSTSGYLVARMMIRKRGMDPDRDFATPRFSGNHHQALRDLIANRCDLAAVYSGAYLLAAREGIAVGRTRILEVSGQLPYDVICAAPGLTKQQVAPISRALLELDVKSEFGRPALGDALSISDFAPPRPGDFAELEREIGD